MEGSCSKHDTGSLTNLPSPHVPLLRAQTRNACETSPLNPQAFNNSPPGPPLFKRKSYRWMLFLLFVVALIFYAFNTIAATFMLIAVLASLGGSYKSQKASKAVAKNAGNFLAKMMAGGPSGTVLLTSGGGGGVYLLSFLLALANLGGDDSSTPSYNGY